MGWRFRKSIKILPGIKVNIGKDGFSSVSVGTRGAHITMGKNGTTLSAGIPGTGFSYVKRLDKPVGQNTTECPYCGHRMRKQWDACPKCQQPLIQRLPQPNNAAAPIQGQPPTTPGGTPSSPSSRRVGCGGLFALLFVPFVAVSIARMLF